MSPQEIYERVPRRKRENLAAVLIAAIGAIVITSLSQSADAESARTLSPLESATLTTSAFTAFTFDDEFGDPDFLADSPVTKTPEYAAWRSELAESTMEREHARIDEEAAKATRGSRVSLRHAGAIGDAALVDQRVEVITRAARARAALVVNGSFMESVVKRDAVTVVCGIGDAPKRAIDLEKFADRSNWVVNGDGDLVINPDLNLSAGVASYFGPEGAKEALVFRGAFVEDVKKLGCKAALSQSNVRP